jgi:hypothetical protein
VEVGIFAKKLTRERLDVRVSERRLEVEIRSEDGAVEYELGLDLYGAVDAAGAAHEILGTKALSCSWSPTRGPNVLFWLPNRKKCVGDLFFVFLGVVGG